MGRKNRNRISEKNISSKNSGSEDEYDDEKVEEEYRISELCQFDIIWKVRLRMIEYCDEMALPLCDYLDNQKMENFIDYVVNL